MGIPLQPIAARKAGVGIGEERVGRSATLMRVRRQPQPRVRAPSAGDRRRSAGPAVPAMLRDECRFLRPARAGAPEGMFGNRRRRCRHALGGSREERNLRGGGPAAKLRFRAGDRRDRLAIEYAGLEFGNGEAGRGERRSGRQQNCEECDDPAHDRADEYARSAGCVYSNRRNGRRGAGLPERRLWPFAPMIGTTPGAKPCSCYLSMITNWSDAAP